MFRHPQKKLIYLFILLIPAFLFLTQPQFLLPLRTQVIQLTVGPLRLVEGIFFEFKKIIFYHRTFDEYKRLSQEVDTLQSRLVGMEEVVRENNRLDKLLQFKRQVMYSSVVANVIGRDPSRWHSSMMIDRGSKSGIQEGMAVVSSLGVVGKIVDVEENMSKVVVLTDPQFSVAVVVERSRESGILSGTLDGQCRLRYLEETSDIQMGDKVVTSKLSLSFPEGLIVGDIVEVQDNLGHQSKEAVVKPAVSISQIEEVLVILK